MKAAVYHPSTGLIIEEVPAPEPGTEFVLIKVSNTGFCGSDHSLIESGLPADGTILGHEVSGVVAGWGSDVRGMTEGSRVVVRPTFCGQCRDCRMGRPYLCTSGRRTIGIGDLPGAFAEYVKVFPQMVIPVPDGVDSRNAALAELFATALHGIRASGSRGGSALVMGGGPIGLAAVRLIETPRIFPRRPERTAENEEGSGEALRRRPCSRPLRTGPATGLPGMDRRGRFRDDPGVLRGGGERSSGFRSGSHRRRGLHDQHPLQRHHPEPTHGNEFQRIPLYRVLFQHA